VCDFGGPTKRVHLVGVSISFEKNFYRLPFTPPTLWSPNQSFTSGGGKVHKYMRTHGSKGLPNRAGMGLGLSAHAGRPGPLRGSVRPPFSCTQRTFICKTESHSHQEAIHKLERERGDHSGRRIAQLEGSTHKWRRMKTLSEASP
jgi:hypothetical protein